MVHNSVKEQVHIIFPTNEEHTLLHTQEKHNIQMEVMRWKGVEHKSLT